MLDPLVVAVGIGLLGSVVAGPVLAYGLQLLPQRRRKTTQWLLIGGAVVFAVLADRLSQGPMGGASVYVLAALPGLVAFLVWRTLLASAFVSLVPGYFVIGELTRGWPTYAPELALDRAVSLQPAWVFVYPSEDTGAKPASKATAFADTCGRRHVALILHSSLARGRIRRSGLERSTP